MKREAIKMTLPLPPTVNHHYGRNGKQTYIAKQGKLFRHQVAVIVNERGYRGEFLSGRLAIKVTLHLKNKRSDIDNRLKPLLDAMEHAELYRNDLQIDDLRVTRGHPVKGGRCEVMIWRL